MIKVCLLLSLCFTLFSSANKRIVPELESFTPQNWQHEEDHSKKSSANFEVVNQSLAPYYDEFKDRSIINIYIGWGKDSWDNNRFDHFVDTLTQTIDYQNLPIDQFRVDRQNLRIKFRNKTDNKEYLIQGGNERNEFIEALGLYDVIMYHGHSRYGRGPAFESYQNYFRLGYNFDFIEVDSRNSYFKSEPIINTDEIPVRTRYLSSIQEEVSFQYRGNKIESSKLPDNSYTVQIEANAKDFKNAKFRNAKQLFFFYSCKNRGYWEEPFRDRFPDRSEKLVFGTKKDSYWLSNSSTVFILSIVKKLPSSDAIVDELELSRDNCVPNCYTSY